MHAIPGNTVAGKRGRSAYSGYHVRSAGLGPGLPLRCGPASGMRVAVQNKKQKTYPRFPRRLHTRPILPRAKGSRLELGA